jgi:hypothetical protein
MEPVSSDAKKFTAQPFSRDVLMKHHPVTQSEPIGVPEMKVAVY